MFLKLRILQLHILVVCLGVFQTLFSQTNNSQLLKVGVYDNPPKIFLNENGKPDGFFIDITKEIGKREDLKFEYVYDSWDNLYKMLEAGTIDILPDMVYSTERDSIFTLSTLPVLSSWLEFFSTKDIEINSINDIQDKRIGVLKGSIQEKLMNDFVDEKLKISFKLITYDDYTASVNALEKHEIDAMFADRFFAFSSLFGNHIKPSGIILRPSGLHFGFTKNKNVGLAERFDKNISYLKNDASSNYYKFLFQWLEKDVKTVVPWYMKLLLIGVVLVLLMVISFVFLLRKSINKKAKQLIEANCKLVESSKNYKKLVETIPDGVYKSSREGSFVEINPAMVKILGYNSKEELLAVDIKKELYVDVEDRDKILLDDLNTELGVYQLRKKDGSIIWVEDHGWYSFNDAGEILYHEGVIRDITDRKNSEKELIEAKERAEESDRLKSAFLANMSHEIRTPMNGILGFAELLEEPNLTNEKQQSYIKIIRKSGERMLNIINDIVNISKIEAGLMLVNNDESNINDQLEYIYNFFQNEVVGKDIQFSLENKLLESDAIIYTDREKVYAVLINLVKNAFKYTEKGFIQFGCNRKDGCLEFFVKDSGIGIPKGREEAIFERFIQAEIVDKMARQGAGLGLSISKAYVEMLGGKIWVEPNIDHGSIFYFTLPDVKPISVSNANAIKITSNENSAVRPLNILIAEDDEASEMLLRISLKDFSNEIYTAKTGLEAVTICRNNTAIDLVFMDIQMPEMNGYEATKEIRKFNKDIVIIAQTAYALLGDQEKALAVGCNDYITKPIHVDMLNKVILTHFGN